MKPTKLTIFSIPDCYLRPKIWYLFKIFGERMQVSDSWMIPKIDIFDMKASPQIPRSHMWDIHHGKEFVISAVPRCLTWSSQRFVCTLCKIQILALSLVCKRCKKQPKYYSYFWHYHWIHLCESSRKPSHKSRWLRDCVLCWDCLKRVGGAGSSSSALFFFTDGWKDTQMYDLVRKINGIYW